MLLETHIGHRGVCAATVETHTGHRRVCAARDTHWT